MSNDLYVIMKFVTKTLSREQNGYAFCDQGVYAFLCLAPPPTSSVTSVLFGSQKAASVKGLPVPAACDQGVYAFLIGDVLDSTGIV
jgi:hypothetical protein